MSSENMRRSRIRGLMRDRRRIDSLKAAKRSLLFSSTLMRCSSDNFSANPMICGLRRLASSRDDPSVHMVASISARTFRSGCAYRRKFAMLILRVLDIFFLILEGELSDHMRIYCGPVIDLPVIVAEVYSRLAPAEDSYHPGLA